MTVATEPLATVGQVRSLGNRIMRSAVEQWQYDAGLECVRTPRLVLVQHGRVEDLLELAASLDWEVA